MSFNFFKNLAKVKGQDLNEGLVNLAVALDKEGVAETAILQTIEEHDERIRILQEATAAFRKEKAEADNAQIAYDRYLNEAETIQSLLIDLADAKEKLTVNVSDSVAAATVAQLNEAELNADLIALLDTVEKQLPILEKEKKESDEAEAWLKEVQESVNEISEHLKTLRATVDQTKREIQQAELEKARNQKKAEQAEVLAGLKKSGNKFDVAINALKGQAEKEKAEAEVYKLKAESLKLPTVPKTEQLIGKYSTSTITTTETTAERLARLKG